MVLRTFTAAVLAAFLAVTGCDEPHRQNRAPTVVITSGPDGVVASESLRFEWSGEDSDGTVAGYYYGLDDSSPATWTESRGVWLSHLTYGEHEFYVQSVDDSGARSVAAVRSFSYEYQGTLPAPGTDTCFDLATWNIENFPKDGSRTTSQVRALMQSLDLDIYAVQEIADTQAFKTMLAGLSGYGGLFSSDDYGSSYQKTGVVYKTGTVTVSGVRQLFASGGNFPRPPIEMTVTAAGNGHEFDFRLIVLHLKAGGSDEDRAQRRGACLELKQYLDAELESGGEPDFVVAGDWNDRLDDSAGENVFQPFLDDSADYCFLTLGLAGNAAQASYIGGALIDHILVTRDALGEYAGGRTTTLRLDDAVTHYEDVVSDHRPVLAAFRVFAGRLP